MKHLLPLFLALVMIFPCHAQLPHPHEYQPPANPATEYYKQQITDQVLSRLNKIDWNQVDRTTSGDTTLYTIPVVVHVLHNYGFELAQDSVIYNLCTSLNSYFLKTTPDTSYIIPKFKSIAANTHIKFKLATIDPYGNSTKGIEHIATYLTYPGSYSNQSKINQWPPEKYLNIWSAGYGSDDYSFGESAYSASYYPYYDGIILSPVYLDDMDINGAARLAARYLNLPYPCDYDGSSCSDADGIADTPPCDNLYAGCSGIYETTCDTPNNQNIMMISDVPCAIMFTYGQAQYMRNILELDFGNRDSLITPHNFTTTGMNNTMPDLPPVADFSLFGYSPTSAHLPYQRFYLQGQAAKFKNNSWNDTITAAAWTFSNNALISASASLTTVINKFYQPGWATVSLAVTGNNTGVNTLTDTHAIYIADSIPTTASGYVQEFTPGTGMDRWPIFNYYNNSFKWQTANVGYTDNSSLEYTSFDTRSFPQNTTGSPVGDIDDIYTPAFDLTGFASGCYLNFMSSGATATTIHGSMNDSLEIDYSADNVIWTKLKVLKKAELDNKGTIATAYSPSTSGDWIAHAIALPDSAITSYTIFRLRYYPGGDSLTFTSTGAGTGNNFYLDNFNFSGFPEDVANINQLDNGVSLIPNPTHGDSYVIIKSNDPLQSVEISVMDITGKSVYETKITTSLTTTRVAIPANAISIKGIYLIHVTTNTINKTEKLVVY